ncbi:MAG TPA: YciI family protein, partial [Acidimicrobiales bacterium]|nr:YciI family protein [Acidimicrobiales bacterium]
GHFSVTDGPFAEAKELIAGFAILEVSSKEEAIEHAKRFAKIVGTTKIDIRRVID